MDKPRRTKLKPYRPRVTYSSLPLLERKIGKPAETAGRHDDGPVPPVGAATEPGAVEALRGVLVGFGVQVRGQAAEKFYREVCIGDDLIGWGAAWDARVRDICSECCTSALQDRATWRREFSRPCDGQSLPTLGTRRFWRRASSARASSRAAPPMASFTSVHRPISRLLLLSPARQQRRQRTTRPPPWVRTRAVVSRHAQGRQP